MNVDQIVSVLSKDEVLLQNLKKLARHLGNNSVQLRRIEKLERENQYPDEILVEILTNWQSFEPENASLEKLCQKLRELRFNNVADKLDKSKGAPIDTLDSQLPATDLKITKVAAKTKVKYTTKVKSSEVDETRDITEDHWVVSLARNPDNDKNEQHTFLILEAIIAGKRKTIFMDFMTNNRRIAENLGRKRGQIRKFEHSGLYGLKNASMLEVRPGQQLSAQSFDISQELGLKLIKNVDDDIAKKDLQPFFNFLGPESVLAASSATSCSNDIGYNCYGWASYQLGRLDKNKFRKLKPDFIKYIAAYPARYLPSKKKSEWNTRSVLFLVAISIFFSSVLSVAVDRYFSFKQL